ncbi:hypothetical protein G6F29_010531 [Rhizopus arrhizus]|nr:hypothetical protein G6F29_010531 [Rhizopus arrhizus]
MKRNYSKFSQPNVLCRIPSHSNEEYEEDFDHLADAQELERRAAFRRKQEEIEEEDFGDFESANDNNNESITKQMETLDVNNKNEDHLVRAVKTKEEEEKEQHLKNEAQFDEQEGEI